MAGVTADFREVLALAKDITLAGDRLQGDAKPVVSKGAVNVKRGMRNDMAGSAWFHQVTPFIDYDLTDSGSVIEAEIGARAEGAGLLENIAYFGGATGGGTVRDPKHALEEEAPRFYSALEALAARAVFG